MHTKIITIALFAFGMALLSALPGCGRPARDAVTEETVERVVEQHLREEGKTADVKIDQDSGAFSITVTDENDQQSTMTMNISEDAAQLNLSGTDGAMTMRSGTSAQVPDTFPDDVPLYPDMTIQMVMEMAGEGFTVVGISDRTLAEVTAFYDKATKEMDWTEMMVMGRDETSSMVNYQKGHRTLMVIAGVEDGEVHINISTSTN